MCPALKMTIQIVKLVEEDFFWFVDGSYKNFLNIMPNSTEQFDHIDF